MIQGVFKCIVMTKHLCVTQSDPYFDPQNLQIWKILQNCTDPTLSLKKLHTKCVQKTLKIFKNQQKCPKVKEKNAKTFYKMRRTTKNQHGCEKLVLMVSQTSHPFSISEKLQTLLFKCITSKGKGEKVKKGQKNTDTVYGRTY